MAAGSAPLLLLGGLRGAAVVVTRRRAPRLAAGPRRAADGGRPAADRAGLGGGADPAAEHPEAPPKPPGLGLLQPGLAGLAHQPQLAAPKPQTAAGRLSRHGRLPPGIAGLAAPHLLRSEPGSAAPASPPAASQRGGESACDQTQEEV